VHHAIIVVQIHMCKLISDIGWLIELLDKVGEDIYPDDDVKEELRCSLS
jgi:hypothetical protein